MRRPLRLRAQCVANTYLMWYHYKRILNEVDYMKYCPSCKCVINEESENCTVCNGALEEVTPDATVKVAVVKGASVSVLEPALKDVGVPCCFEKTDGDIYNAYNIKVSAESDYNVLVPFEMYTKAFDICLGFGFVQEEDRAVSQDEEQSEDNRSYNEKFEAATGVKRQTWQMLGIVLFIVIACLVIWGVDYLGVLFRGLFS